MDAQIDWFIGIDAPDLIYASLRSSNQKVCSVQYVSPIWAWRESRIHGIKGRPFGAMLVSIRAARL